MKSKLDFLIKIYQLFLKYLNFIISLENYIDSLIDSDMINQEKNFKHEDIKKKLNYDNEFSYFKERIDRVLKEDICTIFKETLKNNNFNDIKKYQAYLQNILKKNVGEGQNNICKLLNINREKILNLIESKITKILFLFREKLNKMSPIKFLIFLSYLFILVDFMKKNNENEIILKSLRTNIHNIIIEYNDLFLRRSLKKININLNEDSFERLIFEYSRYLFI